MGKRDQGISIFDEEDDKEDSADGPRILHDLGAGNLLEAQADPRSFLSGSYEAPLLRSTTRKDFTADDPPGAPRPVARSSSGIEEEPFEMARAVAFEVSTGSIPDAFNETPEPSEILQEPREADLRSSDSATSLLRETLRDVPGGYQDVDGSSGSFDGSRPGISDGVRDRILR